MSFINFTNFDAPKQRTVSKEEVLEALLKYETKSRKRAESLVEGFEDQISFNDAISLFSNKLAAVSAFNILEAEGSIEADELEDDSEDVTPEVVDAEGEEYAKAEDRAEEEPEEVEDEIVDGEDGAKEVGEDEPEKELEVSDEDDLEDALGDDGEDGSKEVADEVEEAEGSIEAEELEDDSEDVTPEVVDAEGEEYAKAEDRAEEEPEEVEDEIVDGEDGAKEVGGEDTEEEEDEEVEGEIEEAEGSIEVDELEDDSEDVTPEVVDAEGEEYAKAEDRAEEEPEEVEDEIVDGEDGAKEVGGEEAQEDEDEEESPEEQNAREAEGNEDGGHVEEDGAISTFTKEPTYRFYRDRAEGMIVISKEAMAKLHDEGEVEIDGQTIMMEADLYEATVEVDAMDPNSKDLAKLLKKNKVEMEVVSYGGPTYSTPIVKLVGKKQNLEKVLSDEEYGWGDPDLAEFIEEAVAINELSSGTYKAAMLAALDRKDSRGDKLAMAALNSFGSALAKELEGQRWEVKSSPKPAALYHSAGLKGDAPKHGQYEIEFTGHGKFLNVDPREVIGSDDVSWLMEVIVRPGESRGWGSDFQFTGYRDYGDRVTAFIQFSIRRGSVEVYTRGSDFSMLEFTRQGARKIANIAQTVAIELEMPVKVKHNGIKQFDALALKMGESVEEVTEDWGSSDQSIFNEYIHKNAGKPRQMPSPFDKKLRAAAEDAVDFYWDEWEEYEDDRDGLIDDAVRGYLRKYFRKDFEVLQRMFQPVDEDTVTEKDDAGTHLDKLSDLVGNAKSLMDVGKELKRAGYKYDFSTGMMPMYTINADGFKFAIINKKYVDKGDREVGDIAIGLLESMGLNEGRSIAKIKKEFDKVVNDMAKKVESWKSCKAAGDSKGEAECLGELKELTTKKKSLMAELDAAVGLHDADLELAESVVTEGKYEDMLDKGDGHVHFIVKDESTAEDLADKIEEAGLGDCDFYPERGKIYLRVSFSVGYSGKEVANLKKVEKLVGMKAKAGSPEVWAANESLEESEVKFKKGDKIEYKQLFGMGSKQDWVTLTGVVTKVKNKKKSPLGTLAPHQELTLQGGAVVSPFKNHKDIKLAESTVFESFESFVKKLK